MPSVPRRVRIAIADDHPIFRDGLKRLLESEPGFAIVAEASDGASAVEAVRTTKPDILLLDVAMPRMSGIEVVRSEALAGTRVVILTASIDRGELLRALRHGVRGVVLKEAATRDLIAAIHRVVEGKVVMDEEIADQLAQAVRSDGSLRSHAFGLTPREVEIVNAVTAGDSNREISRRLGISLQTVKHHLTRIFAKTGTASRLELGLLALRRGVGNQEVDDS
jgi:two-component system response regulator DegU